MKLIALLFAAVTFFSFALQHAVKDITYPASVTAPAAVTVQETDAAQPVQVTIKEAKQEKVASQVSVS